MSNRRISFIYILVLISLSWATAHAQVKSRLSIGVVVPLSGSLGRYGQELVDGMRFGITQLALTDKELAEHIDIYPEDGGSSSQDVETTARKLSSLRRADLFVGSLTSTTTASLARVASDVGRPMIIPISSETSLTTHGNHVFRIAPANNAAAKAAAVVATGTLKKKRIAIIHVKNSNYGKEAASSFFKTAKTSDAAIVGKILFESGAEGARKAVAAVRKLNADLIFAPVFYQDAANLTAEATRQGVGATFIGLDGWDTPSLYKSGSKASLKGHYFLTSFHVGESGSVKTMVDAFIAEKGRPPSLFVMMGVDAVLVAAEAFKLAKNNLSSALTKALRNVDLVNHWAGGLSFDSRGEVKRSFALMRTEPNGAEFVQRVMP